MTLLVIFLEGGITSIKKDFRLRNPPQLRNPNWVEPQLGRPNWGRCSEVPHLDFAPRQRAQLDVRRTRHHWTFQHFCFHIAPCQDFTVPRIRT